MLASATSQTRQPAAASSASMPSLAMASGAPGATGPGLRPDGFRSILIVTKFLINALLQHSRSAAGDQDVAVRTGLIPPPESVRLQQK